MSEKLQDKEIESNVPESLDAQVHHEKIQEDREKEAKKVEQGNDTEQARHEIEKVTAEKEQKERHTTHREAHKDTPIKANKASRKLSFNKTMKDTQSELSAPSRAFSKLIHTKAIEKTSEAVGNTIARPNVLLAGGLSAFILTTGIYIWARYAGYPLSGFETIAAFIIGYLLGIIFDFTRIMVTGKR